MKNSSLTNGWFFATLNRWDGNFDINGDNAVYDVRNTGKSYWSSSSKKQCLRENKYPARDVWSKDALRKMFLYSKQNKWWKFLESIIIILTKSQKFNPLTLLFHCFEDTMKAYFCYCHTLFQATIWVGYFIYFRLTPVFFNGCF